MSRPGHQTLAPYTINSTCMHAGSRRISPKALCFNARIYLPSIKPSSQILLVSVLITYTNSTDNNGLPPPPSTPRRLFTPATEWQ
ncbi:hypothetical protein FKM82_014152 [Ascaphus truei]